MEAGGTFFAFRAGDVGGIFPACRYRGIRGCPLTSVKRNAFYESGKNCTQGFGMGWGGAVGGHGVRIWELDQGRRNGVRFRGRQANFYFTGADMGNLAAEQSGSGGGVYDG